MILLPFPCLFHFFSTPTSFFHLFLKAFLLTKWPSLCTLYRVPAHLVLKNHKFYMNLGHISFHICPLCQNCYTIVFFIYVVRCDMPCTRIMLGFTLYNFDNKHPFIVIVIVILTFCTEHGSITAVLYAKFQIHSSTNIEAIDKYDFCWWWIWGNLYILLCVAVLSPGCLHLCLPPPSLEARDQLCWPILEAGSWATYVITQALIPDDPQGPLHHCLTPVRAN